MALKIFTGAKPFLKVDIEPFNITVIEMLPQWGQSGNLKRQRDNFPPCFSE